MNQMLESINYQNNKKKFPKLTRASNKDSLQNIFLYSRVIVVLSDLTACSRRPDTCGMRQSGISAANYSVTDTTD